MRQRTILSSVHGQRWPGCSTGNAFKKIVAALFLFILLNGCIIPAFAASEKKLEKVSILEWDQGAPLVVVDMDALVFDYSGLKAGKELKTIRTLTGLLLFLIGASLVGLLWMRIFVLRKEVNRKTSELLKEKTDLENNKKNMENMSVQLVSVVKELSDDEERYQALTHTSMDGFWVLDKKENLLEVNDAYCNMIGYSREALLSMNIGDLVYEPQDDTVNAFGRQLKAGGAGLRAVTESRMDLSCTYR